MIRNIEAQNTHISVWPKRHGSELLSLLDITKAIALCLDFPSLGFPSMVVKFVALIEIVNVSMVMFIFNKSFDFMRQTIIIRTTEQKTTKNKME